jgi:hypothetical protein
MSSKGMEKSSVQLDSPQIQLSVTRPETWVGLFELYYIKNS